jgi:perosamine synthetase
MNAVQRRQALSRGLSRPWQSEPLLGSHYGEEEIEAAVEAIRSSLDPSVGFGFIVPEIEQFEQSFAEYVETKHAISLSTASVGLDLAMRLLDLQPGDEVICPTINFRAAPTAVLGHGGRLVLCEVEAKTLCADPADVEKRLTPQTRAILATHMNGLSAPMDDLLEVAARHPHPVHGPPQVIGDAARAAGGGYRGTKIGKKGWLNVFSFHTMKNMTTLGEGGMITTDDDAIVPRLREMRQFGGEGWGSSYKMTKVQAAVGSVQLRRLDSFIAARRQLAQERSALLAGCPHLLLPQEPEGCLHTYYLYTLLVTPEWRGEKRDQLISVLREKYGVDCGVANPPMHRVVPFIQRNTLGQELPLSDALGERLFCPPLHPTMSHEDNAYIAAALWEAVEELSA